MKWVRDYYFIRMSDGMSYGVDGFTANGCPWAVRKVDGDGWVIDHPLTGKLADKTLYRTKKDAIAVIERIVATGVDFSKPVIGKRKLSVLRKAIKGIE